MQKWKLLGALQGLVTNPVATPAPILFLMAKALHPRPYDTPSDAEHERGKAAAGYDRETCNLSVMCPENARCAREPAKSRQP